jgi:uncharacterized protein (DUF58 family)
MLPIETILDAPAEAWVVQRQRRGEHPVMDSWHDTEAEAEAQLEFLTLDRDTEATIFPPPSAILEMLAQQAMKEA